MLGCRRDGSGFPLSKGAAHALFATNCQPGAWFSLMAIATRRQTAHYSQTISHVERSLALPRKFQERRKRPDATQESSILMPQRRRTPRFPTLPTLHAPRRRSHHRPFASHLISVSSRQTPRSCACPRRSPKMPRAPDWRSSPRYSTATLAATASRRRSPTRRCWAAVAGSSSIARSRGSCRPRSPTCSTHRPGPCHPLAPPTSRSSRRAQGCDVSGSPHLCVRSS